MNQDGTQNQYELKVKISKVLSYNDANMWGIISCTPIEVKTEGFQPEVSTWNNFVIKGNMIPLQEGNEYDIVIGDKVVDKRWGDYYPILEVKTEKLDTVESQQKFLESITTEIQYKSIIETYPDCMIIDLISEGEVDLTKVRGIGHYTAEKIKEKIEMNRDIGVLIAELSDINLTGNAVKKILKHYQSATLALHRIRESIYNLCEISGFGFKTIDKHALKRGENPTGENRIRAYCHYYFDTISQQGHSWVNEKTFLKEAIEDLSINGKYIRDYLNTENGQYIFYWDKKNYRISTKKMYENEKQTLLNLIRLEESYEPPHIEDVDSSIKVAEESLGIKYTDEQKNAIKKALKHGVFILNGKGGTGKTTIVRGIVEVLEAHGLFCHSCALSGKASQVLLSKGISSATIHRTLGLGIDENSESEGISVDVLIVDESSMINAGLFKKVVQALENGSKIIIVGDSGQLSGIGHGDVLRDLLATDLFAKVELQQIHRQAQDSGIIEVASKVREGKQIIGYNATGKEVFGVNKDMIVVGFKDRENILTNLINILKVEAKKIKSPEDLLNLQIVTANKDRGAISSKAINIVAQEIFNDLGKPAISRGGYDFREGDKVIVKGNTYGISYFKDLFDYNKFLEFQEKISLGLASEYDFIVDELFQLQIEIDNLEMELYLDCDTSGYDDEQLNLIENELQNNPQLMGLYEKKEELEKELEKYPQAQEGDLFNGTMGIIKKIDQKNKCIHVEFENLGYVVLNNEGIDSLELAYAVTCHRLQGSTIKNVIVVLDFTSYGLLSRQWVYTAITRASRMCVMLVETGALHKAIGTDASGNRNTFLGDMIKQVEPLKDTISSEKAENILMAEGLKQLESAK